RVLEQDPRLRSKRGYRHTRSFLQVAVAQHRDIQPLAAGSNLRLLGAFTRLTRRKSERYNYCIRIKLWRRCSRRATELLSNADVLECTSAARRMNELARESLAAFHDGFAPDIFLHALGRGHPRASCFAPPRRTGDRHFHAELVADADGVFECLLPFGCHVSYPPFDNLRCLQRCVEVLIARNSHPMHPLEVQLDTFFGNVAVHPVPPNSRLGRITRILEI